MIGKASESSLRAPEKSGALFRLLGIAIARAT